MPRTYTMDDYINASEEEKAPIDEWAELVGQKFRPVQHVLSVTEEEGGLEIVCRAYDCNGRPLYSSRGYPKPVTTLYRTDLPPFPFPWTAEEYEAELEKGERIAQADSQRAEEAAAMGVGMRDSQL